MSDPKKPTLDERIEALVLTAELQEKRLEATEKEQRRTRAALRAALQAWTDYEEEEDRPS